MGESGEGGTRWRSPGYLAVAIGVMPFVGYLIALLYELGQTTFYGIPMSLVQVDLTTIFIAGSALVGFGYFVYYSLYVNFIEDRGDPDDRTSARAIWNAKLNQFGPFVLLIAFGLGFTWTWRYIIVPIAICVLLYYQSYLRPRWRQGKSGGNIVAKVHRQHFEDFKKRNLTYRLDRLSLSNAFPFAAIIVFVLGVAFYSGYGRARLRDDYPIIDSSQLAVVKTYGDILIAVRFDSESKTFTKGSYTILKIGSDPMTITTRDVGSLKPTDAQQRD